MGKVSIQITPTPNPNAIRIGLSTTVAPKALSFASAALAESDPLAKKLFAVPGVSNVFMINNFVTVNKDPGAEWSAIEPRVAQIIRDHFDA